MVQYNRFLLILLILPCQNTVAIVPIIIAGVGFVSSVITISQELYNYFKHDYEADQRLEMIRMLKDVLPADDLKLNLESIKDVIQDRADEIETNVPGLVDLNARLSKVFGISYNINERFIEALRYLENPKSVNNNKIRFAESIISQNNCGLKHDLNEIHTLLTTGDEFSTSGLILLNIHMELFKRSKRILKSPQQLIYSLFLTVISTEIKGYLTIRYSYDILESQGQVNYTDDVQNMEIEYANRINFTIDAFRDAMTMASTEISNDEPKIHVDGVTYTELKYMFQVQIANTYDIDQLGKYGKTCSDYVTEKGTGNCKYGGLCYHRKCYGYLHDCKLVFDSYTSSYNVCLSFGARRYEYLIDTDHNKRYGLKLESCSYEKKYRPYYAYDEICKCVCEESYKGSQRYFSLDVSRTNQGANYVVTGARFVQVDETVYIQVQQGHLLPGGKIDQSTVSWVDLPRNPERYVMIWNKSRAVNLDDLKAPKNHVITGLSFYKTTRKGGDGMISDRLHLRIHSFPLYFKSGKISKIVGETTVDMPDAMNEIDLSDLDVPTRGKKSERTKKSENNRYLTFQTSSWETDAGQSVIPFIDLQNITTVPATPLSGAGIYHRAKNGTGGFLALKLFSYDFTQNMQANFSQDLMRDDYDDNDCNNDVQSSIFDDCF